MTEWTFVTSQFDMFVQLWELGDTRDTFGLTVDAGKSLNPARIQQICPAQLHLVGLFFFKS